MNHLHYFPKKFAAIGLLVTLAALVLFSSASAQPASEAPQRWLFIFDTSAAMKPRLPAIKAELQNIFLSSISSQLTPDATIGVWTFNQKISAGEFPLITWKPQMAAEVTSNIVKFLKNEHYLGKTTFAALKPILGRVIDDSERLTIIIFCDGDDTFKLTPYDDGINQSFKQMQAQQEKSNQPFVVVVRTQQGEFIGATVNFPPGNLNLPVFPPLPPPVQTAPANPPPAVVIVPVPPVVSLPPLVIVGTNVGTNINDLPKIVPPASRVTVTNSPPAASVTHVVATNNETAVAVSANAPPPALSPATNPPVSENIAVTPAVAPSTASNVAPANNISTTASGGGSDTDNGTRHLIFIGIGLLVVAMALVIFLVLQRPRAARESLITSSMSNDPHPPAKK